MASRSVGRRSVRQLVNCDLELRPLMNVFIVLIPMLLMSAVFMEIRVIEMSLPREAEASEVVAKPTLDLAIRILADRYVVVANGSVVQSVPRTPNQIPNQAAAAQLTQVLSGIAGEHPDHKEIRIIADSGTHYQEIVAVMDLARAAGLSQAALEGAGTTEL
jgi:biopolymer transport protein ExbD